MMAIIWIGVIILFAAIEIATVGLTSIWFSGGALAALGAYALGLEWQWQFAVFVVVTLILLVFTRPWALRYVKPHLTKTNYEQMIAERVCLTERVDNLKQTGTAVYKGQEWSARAYDGNQAFEAGEIVTVKEIRGVTLYVVADGNMPRLREGGVQQ